MGVLISISEMAGLGIEIEEAPPEENQDINFDYTQQIVKKLKNLLSEYWNF